MVFGFCGTFHKSQNFYSVLLAFVFSFHNLIILQYPTLYEGCSKYKCFIGRTHKDIFKGIFEIYNDDADFNNFLNGWNTKQEEVGLLVRIELYKNIDKDYIKQNKDHSKITTYTLTKKGQNFLQSTLRNWFYFESGRCEVESVIYGN